MVEYGGSYAEVTQNNALGLTPATTAVVSMGPFMMQFIQNIMKKSTAGQWGLHI